MITTEQQQLYQSLILEHNKKPKNFGKLEAATHSAEGFNPLCGDHFWVYAQLDGEGNIERVNFEGSGCAISKASASLMTERMRGKPAVVARQLFDDFMSLVKGENDSPELLERLGKLRIFSGIAQYPSRIKCAALAWHALKNALEQEHKVVSTE